MSECGELPGVGVAVDEGGRVAGFVDGGGVRIGEKLEQSIFGF